MFTISKWGLAYAEPIFFVGVRMILAGLLLCGYILIRTRGLQNIAANFKRDWLLFLQIIIFHIVYITYICDLYALKHISSTESAFIYSLSPFVAALISYFWFGELMTFKKWIGLSLGLIAMIPSFFSIQAAYGGVEGLPLYLFSTEFSHALPILITLIAVVTSSYGWIVVRTLVQRGYSPIVINGIGMTFGGALALLTSYFTETWVVTAWIPFIQATILIIVVANIIFYNFYGYLLKYYTATFLSFAGFMCPFFAAILGRIFLGETFSWTLVFSFIVTCIGLFIFYHEELKQGYIRSEK